MEITINKIISVLLWTAIAYFVAITMWYLVTVILWLAYKVNGGTAPYLRYLKIKGLHLAKVR